VNALFNLLGTFSKQSSGGPVVFPVRLENIAV
jgi:hypothetical protein